MAAAAVEGEEGGVKAVRVLYGVGDVDDVAALEAAVLEEALDGFSMRSEREEGGAE